MAQSIFFDMGMQHVFPDEIQISDTPAVAVRA